MSGSKEKLSSCPFFICFWKLVINFLFYIKKSVNYHKKSPFMNIVEKRGVKVLGKKSDGRPTVLHNLACTYLKSDDVSITWFVENINAYNRVRLMYFLSMDMHYIYLCCSLAI